MMSCQQIIQSVNKFYENTWKIEIVNSDRALDIQDNGFIFWIDKVQSKLDCLKIAYIVKSGPKFRNMFLPEIKKIYRLNDTKKFYRGFILGENFDFKNFYGPDRSYSKKNVFDVYDLIVEFDLKSKTGQKRVPHHNNCYRGPLEKNNVKITKIIFNIFSEIDIHKIMEKILDTNVYKKDKPLLVASLMDMNKIDKVYVCGEI